MSFHKSVLVCYLYFVKIHNNYLMYFSMLDLLFFLDLMKCNLSIWINLNNYYVRLFELEMIINLKIFYIVPIIFLVHQNFLGLNLLRLPLI